MVKRKNVIRDLESKIIQLEMERDREKKKPCKFHILKENSAAQQIQCFQCLKWFGRK